MGALIILALLLIDICLVGPYNLKIEELDRDLRYRHKQKRWYLQTIKNAENIERQFVKYEPYFPVARGSIEEAKAVVLAEIENRSSKNGVLLVDVTPRDTQDQGLLHLFEVETYLISD